jgi:predicted PurR-regulated permease PerM
VKELFKTKAGQLKSAWQAMFNKKSLDGLPGSDSSELRRTAILLIAGIIRCSGQENEQLRDAFKNLLVKDFSIPEIENILAEAANGTPETHKEQLRKLADIPAEGQHKIISAMISLAYADREYDCTEREFINTTAREFGLDQEEVDQLAVDIYNQNQRKKRLIQSGAGIIAALVVLLVFILTATWLLSLLIGLILAYIFLPMEKWYERHLSKGGWLYFVSRILGNVSSSIGKITSKPDLSLEELKRKEREQLVSRATTATLATVTILALVLASAVVLVSYRYVSSGVRSAYAATASHMAQQRENSDKQENSFVESLPFGDTIKGWADKLEEQKVHVERLPIIREAIEIATTALKDEQSRKEMFSFLLKRTGGVVSMTAGIVYKIIMFLLNTLLTFFFFSLLLRKMADNVNNQGDTAEQQSSYIVKTIIHNDWMPNTDESSLKEAQSIISEVINRLKLWLRGYLMLVLIDSTVYSTIFTLLGVPYSLVFGIIAGMGVLLPYIGPVASGALTVLACLVLGDGQSVMLQIVLVLTAYLIYNGVIEQFILYPRVIGDRLGLTTLETIIVVLLGALFAGIFGMIFALPTASVLKYLLQQVYAVWKPESRQKIPLPPPPIS